MTPSDMQQAMELRILLGFHSCTCLKHAQGPAVHSGVIGLAPDKKQIVCAWCRASEEFAAKRPAILEELIDFARPTTTDDMIVVQDWLCQLMDQLDRFYEIHTHCIPDMSHPQKATLVKLATDDGELDLRDKKIGTEYIVYPNSIREMTWGRSDNRGGAKVYEFSSKHVMVYAAASDTGHAGYLPMELFELEQRNVH